eukprot:4613475-Pleurochrysis_carterae.AAC.1
MAPALGGGREALAWRGCPCVERFASQLDERVQKTNSCETAPGSAFRIPLCSHWCARGVPQITSTIGIVCLVFAVGVIASAPAAAPKGSCRPPHGACECAAVGVRGC